MKLWRTKRDLWLDGKRWRRLEATVLIAESAEAMADAEAELVAECARAEVAVEFIGGSDLVRTYRLHLGAPK